ncbi:MAG: dihydrofolate reductase [Bacteroidota bacterium]|jgi:dihydrofolate reductase|nr:dihydrofolate reductase [Saprospiraceae bacterium]
MIVSAIVAVAKNGVIGAEGQIPWYLPADLAWFKKTTLGHHIIMGRNSFHSIGRPLPKRTNIVVTRDPFFSAEGVLVAHSVEEALGMAFDNEETEVFIIGGGQIYRESIDLWDKLYLTEVKTEPEGDVFFPETDSSEWTEIWCEERPADDKNEFDCTFHILERKEAEED